MKTPKIYIGTKVLTAEGTQQTALFTSTSYAAIVGREFYATDDYVMAMNTDTASNNTRVIGTFYNPQTKNLGVQFNQNTSGNVRVNYLIAVPR